MRNIVNEKPNKPTYAELESKVSKHDDDCKSSLLIILVLVVTLAICAVGWLTSSSDAKFYKDYKNEYFDKWRACSIARTVTPVDYVDQARLKARESELSKAEFEFQVTRAQWEAQIQVKEAKLDLEKERRILERELELLNNKPKIAK